MNILDEIRKLYFGKNYRIDFKFIDAEPLDIDLDNILTVLESQPTSNYSLIDGIKCCINKFDEDTQEWVLTPLDVSLDKEFRYVDISHLDVFKLTDKDKLTYLTGHLRVNDGHLY